ncbi:unnamed protein product [Echinostoma caproni]|uniref:Uncharacterized protein n=1 Tax=Echinostoma caproni TaxID=27848 RepID=A0A3P8KH62_9TREM|nr:unnamed protein product [Echinostoma caproni]
MEYVLSVIEDEQLIIKAKVDILMAVYLVKKAWASAHPHVLSKAFMKAGFKSTLIQPVMRFDRGLYSLCLLMIVFLKKKSPGWNLIVKKCAEIIGSIEAATMVTKATVIRSIDGLCRTNVQTDERYSRLTGKPALNYPGYQSAPFDTWLSNVTSLIKHAVRDEINV